MRSSAEIVRQYLDSVLRKDHAAVDRLFHREIEYVINGSRLPDRDPAMPPISAECIAALPWLGHYRVKEAVKEFIDHMHENLDVTAYGERRVISEAIRRRLSAGSDCIRLQRVARRTSHTPFIYRRGMA